MPAAETRAEHVLEAHGYMFATPENLAAMSGQLKDFFDRTYYAALDRLAGRPYAILICAGSDGRNAVQQIERIATGWRLKSDCGSADRLHARPEPARDPAAENHRCAAAATLRGTRRHDRGRLGAGYFLIIRAAAQARSEPSPNRSPLPG
jgi:multimeric flavodoxin WrbA